MLCTTCLHQHTFTFLALCASIEFVQNFLQVSSADLVMHKCYKKSGKGICILGSSLQQWTCFYCEVTKLTNLACQSELLPRDQKSARLQKLEQVGTVIVMACSSILKGRVLKLQNKMVALRFNQILEQIDFFNLYLFEFFLDGIFVEDGYQSWPLALILSSSNC